MHDQQKKTEKRLHWLLTTFSNYLQTSRHACLNYIQSITRVTKLQNRNYRPVSAYFNVRQKHEASIKIRLANHPDQCHSLSTKKSQGKLDTSTVLELYTHIHKLYGYQRLPARKAKKEKDRTKNLALIKWKMKQVLKKSSLTQCWLTTDPPKREEL